MKNMKKADPSVRLERDREKNRERGRKTDREREIKK